MSEKTDKKTPAKNKPAKNRMGLLQPFASLKLTVWLLLLFTILCLIGVLLPQRPYMIWTPSISYFEQLAIEFFEARQMGEAHMPIALRLANYINPYDMFRSIPFLVVIVLMLINLIACSIDRLQKLLKSFKAPMLRLDSTREKSFRNAVTVKLPSAGIDQVENKLSHMGRLERSQEGDITYYSSERGRIGRFGVYIIHLSVLVLAVGAMIGVLYGKRGILNLYEGESSSKFGLFYSRQRLDMGFKVTCDEVEVTRYASGEVEDYLSFLTIQRPGVQPEKIKLEVNRPYKSPEGFTLYQSDYGTAMILRIQDLESGRIHQARLDVESKDSISVPGTDMKVIIESFQDDRMYGPRLELRILHPDGFVEKPLLLLNYPAHDEKRPNARTKVTPAIIEYTGLQVGYDPGVWVVYVSFVLFMIGLCVAFFMPHRRLYARLEGKRLVLAGVTNKYSDSLEEKIKKIARELGEAGRKK